MLCWARTLASVDGLEQRFWEQMFAKCGTTSPIARLCMHDSRLYLSHDRQIPFERA